MSTTYISQVHLAPASVISCACKKQAIIVQANTMPAGWVLREIPIRNVPMYGDTIWKLSFVCPECDHV